MQSSCRGEVKKRKRRAFNTEPEVTDNAESETEVDVTTENIVECSTRVTTSDVTDQMDLPGVFVQRSFFQNAALTCMPSSLIVFVMPLSSIICIFLSYRINY